ERRVVVALDLEDDGESVADVDGARVLTRSLEHAGPLRRQALQIALARLVGAVLGPHHGEDPELREGGRAPEDREDLGVLGVREPVLGGEREIDRRLAAARAHRAAPATASTSEPRIARPSSPPKSASTACSGCGISPKTLPRALRTPATFASEPFGFA